MGGGDASAGALMVSPYRFGCSRTMRGVLFRHRYRGSFEIVIDIDVDID
jgi:hypothetical protein